MGATQEEEDDGETEDYVEFPSKDALELNLFSR